MPEGRSFIPSTDVWSRLPTELLREIILHSASTSNSRARTLRSVCRCINIWILPILFHTLVLTSPDHISRFAATLLPKKKLHIPALKSQLHIFPCPLSSYIIESLALVVQTRLPSVEIALESVAPAFSRLKNLVISGQNLSSNAHWLRQHPIHPQQMMILHFGFPQLVNFHEPIFQSVTHLYTSTLTGHRNSSVADLPSLTHVAVHTRIDHSEFTAGRFAKQLLNTLEAMPQLQCLVLVLNSNGLRDPKLQPWAKLLKPCFADERFFLLPYFRDVYLECQDVLASRSKVWDRARQWRQIESQDDTIKTRFMHDVSRSDPDSSRRIKNYMDAVWYIDLVQRDLSPMTHDHRYSLTPHPNAVYPF